MVCTLFHPVWRKCTSFFHGNRSIFNKNLARAFETTLNAIEYSEYFSRMRKSKLNFENQIKIKRNMILIRNLCFEQLILFAEQNYFDGSSLFIKEALTLFSTTPLEHHLKMFLVPCAPPKQSKQCTNVSHHTFNCFIRQKGPFVY